MSAILVNNSSVQAQSGVLGTLLGGAVQMTHDFIAVANENFSWLDGAARFNAEIASRNAKEAAEAACETSQNLRVFLENSSRTMVGLDQATSHIIS